jgi:hypothetical protein
MPALWKEPSVRENGKLNKFIGEAYPLTPPSSIRIVSTLLGIVNDIQ